MLACIAIEARRTGAAPVDGVTGAPVSTDTALTAAIAIETRQALCEQEENTVADVLTYAKELLEWRARPDGGDHLGCSCLPPIQRRRHNQLQQRHNLILEFNCGRAAGAPPDRSRVRIESIRTGGAGAVRAAVRQLTPRRLAGGASPALVAAAEAIHAVAVSAAVCRPAARRVNTQDGGDAASTAPPGVRFTVHKHTVRVKKQLVLVRREESAS